MSIKRKACIAGIYEHPTRRADGMTTAQLHAEVAFGALADAGLSDAEILDLIHAIAIFAWANRLMLNLGEPVFPA